MTDDLTIQANALAAVRSDKVWHLDGILLDQLGREIPADSLDGTALTMLLEGGRIILRADGTVAAVIP